MARRYYWKLRKRLLRERIDQPQDPSAAETEPALDNRTAAAPTPVSEEVVEQDLEASIVQTDELKVKEEV